MSQATLSGRTASVSDARRELLNRIEELSYLPTTVGVALKFVQLGKDPDAEPAEYAKVISADAALSSKILALANSSWAGVRNKVTTVKTAVNLLGLGTVRTLAVSYCMTGLHNELRLSPAESQTFWEASLSKAIAARSHARAQDPKRADEGFVIGLFEDFALPVMYSVLREEYLAVLRDSLVDINQQLQRERELFGMDHTEVGRIVAQKLELPELFVDTIAFSHNYDRLLELVPTPPLRDAAYVGGLLPHALNSWSRTDADALRQFLGSLKPAVDLPAFVAEVQTEFVQLYSFFHEGKQPETELPNLLAAAAREMADNTTTLVSQIQEMVRETVETGVAPQKRAARLELEANLDPLTQALDREGFRAAARTILGRAARYGSGLALCCLELDSFQGLAEQLDGAACDQALQATAAQTRAALPKGAIVGRIGTAEFVVLIEDCSPDSARDVADRILAHIERITAGTGAAARHLTCSAGMLCLKPSNGVRNLDELVRAAEQLMTQARRRGGNRTELSEA